MIQSFNLLELGVPYSKTNPHESHEWCWWYWIYWFVWETSKGHHGNFTLKRLSGYPEKLSHHPILEHTDSRYFEWIHLLNLSGHCIAAAGGGSFHWRSNGKSVTVISLRFLNDIWLIISDNWWFLWWIISDQLTGLSFQFLDQFQWDWLNLRPLAPVNAVTPAMCFLLFWFVNGGIHTCKGPWTGKMMAHQVPQVLSPSEVPTFCVASFNRTCLHWSISLPSETSNLPSDYLT